MWSDYTMSIFSQISEVVRTSQRDLRRGVLPKHVQARLPYPRAEGSVRRDMGNMRDAGLLVRLGSETSRQGYRLPTAIERLSFQILGTFPYGAERLPPTLVNVR